MAKHQAVIRFRAIAFPNAPAANQHAEADGRGEAIRREGQNLVVSEADAERLAAAGVSFAYRCDRDGQVLTVPVNG